LAICTADLNQMTPRVTATGTGSAIFVWFDRRNEVLGDIYAQLVTGAGDLVAAFLQEQNMQVVGDAVQLTWRLSHPAAASDFQVHRAQAPQFRFEPHLNANLTGLGTQWTLTDHSCLPGESYRYRIHYTGEGQEHGILFETEPVTVSAKVLRLETGHPNPFNPSTRIAYVVPDGCPVKLEIYDALGRFVVRLVDQPQAPGWHEAVWNGRDARGQAVGSGAYFVFLQAGEEVRTSSVTLLK
jgi:hypothetical protein